jgi:hypothetical protein
LYVVRAALEPLAPQKSKKLTLVISR